MSARPKKLRGDAARAAKFQRSAAEASRAALDGDARRRTLTRIIATLVERLGGKVELPFREVAGSPDLGMEIADAGTPDATVRLSVGPRSGVGIIVGDRVVVRRWAPAPDASGEAPTIEVAWPGRVSAIDEGELLVVRLDEPARVAERFGGVVETTDASPTLERVVVPKAWADLEVSTRVDTEAASDGEANQGS